MCAFGAAENADFVIILFLFWSAAQEQRQASGVDNLVDHKNFQRNDNLNESTGKKSDRYEKQMRWGLISTFIFAYWYAKSIFLLWRL